MTPKGTPNNVKALARAYGYRLYEVAQAVDIPLRTLNNYCSGRSPFPHKKLLQIADFLGVEIEDLYPGNKKALIQYAGQQSARGENEDMKRRDLLYLLGLAGGALLWDDIDLERVGTALARPAQIDTAVVEGLTAINVRYWEIYLAATTKASVQSGVLGQLRTVIQFLREPHTTEIHRQLCTLASELAQLAGEIYFDQHAYPLAQSCYVFAASAAKEAAHYDLWASALIRHAFLPLYDHRYAEALPLLQDAQRFAARGDSALPVRQWASAVLAEAESGTGNLAACQAALDQANSVLDLKDNKPPAWTRFDGSRLAALRGACFVRLAQPDLADRDLQEALAQFGAPGRKRGMVLLDLATAAAQKQDVERACSYLDQVITIVEAGASGFLRRGVATVRSQLQPFASAATVQAIDQRFLMLT